VKAGLATRDQIWGLSLAEVARLIEERELSAVEVTRAMLGRVTALDGRLRSFLTVTAESALEEAARADQEILRGEHRGLLHGVPVALKDLVFTQGIRTTCGSSILADWKPEYDATVVERLRAAGAVFLGKLSMTEFAGIAYHASIAPPANPWNSERWPGASSSGAGVAVAAGLCFGAVGSDTGGSLRFPAAACGVVGLKATYGAVSRYGVFELAPSLDHVGPMARTVEDVAILFEAIAGFDAHDPTTRRGAVPGSAAVRGEVPRLRIGFDEDFCRSSVDEQVAAALVLAAHEWEKLGASVREVRITGLAEATSVWGTIFAAESGAVHEEMYAGHASEYNSILREVLEHAFRVRGVDYARAHAKRQAIRRVFDNLFEPVDLLLWPAMSEVAQPVEVVAPGGRISPERAEDLLRFTAPLSLTGHPVLSLPCGFNSGGMPIGLQLIARHGEEAALLRAGFAYQEATDWHKRKPPLEP
jgi:amidase